MDEWDHKLFGFSDVEAEMTDPQQKMVLDGVHMALEDAGITRKQVDGSDTAVYIGKYGDIKPRQIKCGASTGSRKTTATWL